MLLALSSGLFGKTIISNWGNWLISIIIVVIFIALAFASRYILEFIMRFAARRTKTILDDLIVEALKIPVFIGLIVGGIWIGIERTIELSAYLQTIHKIFISLFIIVIAIAVSRVTNAILTWYGAEVATRTKSDIDDKLIPLLRRVVTAVVFILAILFILQAFNVQIAPLLAGLGIGGVAVALALQPTLSNFLAGTYVMSDALIHRGDYIMLDGGQEGYVEDIGWRTTRLRHWQGNLIIMPNAKLSDAVVINFDKPDKAMSFAVDCGVSYESDLDKVEKMTVEVAREVSNRLAEGAKDYEPVLRYKEFGDSNIKFSVVLKSVDRGSQFILKHEFIKTLHKRYQEEGIDIQYPVRKLLFPNKAFAEGEKR